MPLATPVSFPCSFRIITLLSLAVLNHVTMTYGGDCEVKTGQGKENGCCNIDGGYACVGMYTDLVTLSPQPTPSVPTPASMSVYTPVTTRVYKPTTTGVCIYIPESTYVYGCLAIETLTQRIEL